MDKNDLSAIIIVPWFYEKKKQKEILFDNYCQFSYISPEERLQELLRLSLTVNLIVVKTYIVHIRNINNSTYLNEGQIKLILNECGNVKPDIIVIGNQLTAIQQRNLQKLWNIKVVDKTRLIINIFSDRANTSEGYLQVNLAYLNYQRTRLVRSWTHLERQKGGYGFFGGPGESQIEVDRRSINKQILSIKKKLEKVRCTRKLHRNKRKNISCPVVSFLGYTNSGKSTLFNCLTNSNVFVKDLLFSTLDTTMRKLRLNTNKSIIFSDTVGFISDLPPELIVAFRATLEELYESDLLIHVIDISNPNANIQYNNVIEILKTLNLDNKPIIRVFNKLDLLSLEQRKNKINKSQKTVFLSALTGEGIINFIDLIKLNF